MPSSSKLPGPATTNSSRVVTPRKRRRRVPGPGASEDCFACRRMQARCDRQRPYCTVCIDQGLECSGYKQTLTWGVGVASRGKLRGSVLPVIDKTVSPPTSPTAPIQVPGSGWGGQGGRTSVFQQPHNSSSTVVLEKPTTFDFVQIDLATLTEPSSPTPIDLGTRSSSRIGFVGSLSNLYRRRHKPDSFLPSLHRIQAYPEESLEKLDTSNLGSSLSDFSDSEYSSPIDVPQTPNDLWIMPPPLSAYHSNFWPLQANSAPFTDGVLSNADGPTPYPDFYSIPKTMNSSVATNHKNYSDLDGSPIFTCDSPLIFSDYQSLGGTGNHGSDRFDGSAFLASYTPQRPAASDELPTGNLSYSMPHHSW